MVKKNGTGILVIKLGTRILTTHANRLNESEIGNIVSQISTLISRGYKVLLVSSGAIGAGMGVLGLRSRPNSLPMLQACAAIGQSELMKVYSKFLKTKNHIAAQVLLTQDDFNNRERYLNAKNTLLTLLDNGVIPIINENDTVSTDEIRLGDNDRLSSLVAALVEAKRLIILTDVDNLRHKNGEPVYRVEEVTKEIMDLAGETSGDLGVGGMVTKLEAARWVSGSGITCHFANGNAENVLLFIVDGKEKVGTTFEPCKNCKSARKRWIEGGTKTKGSLVVDDGAKDALAKRNKSLLPSGIVSVDGTFAHGDSIGIYDKAGEEFARGLTNYSSKEISKIKGLKTNQIEGALGHKDYDEVIHKDNLVIL